MLPARWAAANSAGSRVSRICAPSACSASTSSSVSGVHLARERLIERGAFLAVEHGVVSEVGGSFGLVGGDDLDEGFLAHGLERVVGAALLAERGDGFLAERFAAEGAGAVGGIDEALVGQREQFVCAANRRACRRVASADQPRAARRSGRPTSPMNRVSPVRTDCGCVSLASRS